MAKITRTTVKSFIKNTEHLYIKCKSRFNGMTDGCDRINDDFDLAVTTSDNYNNTLGIQGAWFVGSSRDWFTEYDDGEFKGIEVYNCCGTFILAAKKLTN